MLRSLLLLSLLLLLAAPAMAGSPSPEAAATPEPSPSAAPRQLASPRATLETFLDAMARASPLRPDLEATARSTMDLAELSPLTRAERGAELARRLEEVLHATGVVPAAVPEDPGGDEVVLTSSPAGRVALQRQPDGSWLFSADTVAGLPALYRALIGQGRIQSGVQDLPWLLQQGFAGLLGWQWLGLFVTAGLALLASRVVARFAWRLTERWLRWRDLEMDSALRRRAARPVGWLAAALLVAVSLPWLHLPDTLLTVLAAAAKFVGAGAGVLSAYHAVDLLSLYCTWLCGRTDHRFDDMLLPLVRRTLKVFIALFGLIFVAQNLDINVWSLFAGFSIAGAAVALAGQDTMRNFFGSVTVILDRPFRVGDWVNVGGVDGTVEDLGFRSTRIRTFYDSVVTLPNAQLLTASVDNYGQRAWRRYSTRVRVEYSTPPDRLEAFCEGVRQLILQHPYTRRDNFHVYVNEFGESGLEIMLYCFFGVPDWASELRERERLILDVLRLAERLGVRFALPARTVRLQQEPAS